MIEAKYQADPQDRALFGFSSRGCFSLHMLLTKPGMFRRHVAASCVWPGAGEYFLECARHRLAATDFPSADLYLAVGSCEEDQLPRFHQLTPVLQNIPNLRVTTRIFDGEGHSAGMIAKAFLEGVPKVFQMYSNAFRADYKFRSILLFTVHSASFWI